MHFPISQENKSKDTSRKNHQDLVRTVPTKSHKIISQALVASLQPAQIAFVPSMTCHRANTSNQNRQFVVAYLPRGSNVPAREINF
jgi:hypothetical protein